MRNYFEQMTLGNRQNLVRWRERYSPKEYPYKVVLNLFYDLLPLNDLWTTKSKDFGQKKFDDYESAFKENFEVFRFLQLKFYAHSMDARLAEGARAGNLESTYYNKFITEAQNGSNKAIEELEYAYTVFVPIRAVFVDWFATCEMGYLPEVAQQDFLASSGVFIIKNWNSYEEVFESFKMSCVNGVGGSKNGLGQQVIETLYQPLPDYWK